jgi:rare lipoprotein A
MLRYGKSALGLVAQPRMAIALIAATVALGGTVSEASAKSKHRHHHKHHHHHVAKKAAAETNPFEANASIGPFAPIAAPDIAAPARTGGRSFSGVASFYGNEAGNKTASMIAAPSSAAACSTCPRAPPAPSASPAAASARLSPRSCKKKSVSRL